MNVHFPRGESSHISKPKELNKTLAALERIADNSYFNENPLKKSSASGLEGWVCREAVTTDNLKAMQEQDENTLIKKLSEALRFKYVRKE